MVILHKPKLYCMLCVVCQNFTHMDEDLCKNCWIGICKQTNTSTVNSQINLNVAQASGSEHGAQISLQHFLYYLTVILVWDCFFGK